MTDIQAIRERHRHLTIQLNERPHGMMYHECRIAHTDRATLLSALSAAEARAEAAEAALRLFMGAACPVSSEINPRGYNWSQAYLDQALTAARTLKGATDGR